MIRILALSALLALNFANGASARPTPQRRQLGFLPLEGLSSLNPMNPNSQTNSASNTNGGATANTFANAGNRGSSNPSANSIPDINNTQSQNANPGNFNTVENSDNGVSNADPNPAAFLSSITGAATGGLNSSFNQKRTAAKIPGFTGPSIEADVPSNLLPSVPTGATRKRFIHNADFASGETPAAQGSEVLAAVNADAAKEKRFIRNADYQEAEAPASAANSVVAAASAAEGTSASA